MMKSTRKRTKMSTSRRSSTTAALPPTITAVALLALLAAFVPCLASGAHGGPFALGPQFAHGRRQLQSPCRPATAAESESRRSSSSVVSSSAAAVVALGVPRGGSGSGGGFFGDRFPLFGRRRRKRSSGKEGGGGDGDGDDPTLYPPLTRDEIVDKLNLPAYCVTDAAGTGIAVMGEKGVDDVVNGVINGGNGGQVYLFLSRSMANEALRLARAQNGHLDGLKVTALHLGKVWFRLLHNDDVRVSMKPPDSAAASPATTSPEADPSSRRVRFRLVPGTRDLVGARVLLGLSPPDAEALRIALEPSVLDDSVPSDVDAARSIIQRATDKSPAFKTPFDEVPVFLMPRMRVRRPEDGDGEGEAPPKLPLFLSSRNMVKTFLEMARENPHIMSPGFGGQDGSGGEGQENTNNMPMVQLVELNKIVEMMQEESEMDFRNIVILPPVEDEDDNNGNGSDDDDSDSDDDSDDGGGGDSGIAAQAEPEPEYEPFVSMEMSVFGNGGQELVPMQ